MGFGLFQVADNVLFHWILGLHHIRMDDAEPLTWDLAVFVAGLAIGAIGWAWTKRSRASGGGGMRASLTLLVCLAAMGNALPNPAGLVAVRFAEGVGPARIMAAASAGGVRLVGDIDRDGTWLVELAGRDLPPDFARLGAIVLDGPVVPFGCYAWSRA